jgi:ubiquinone/menaquinone biosynthesis C-methylase UbiE
MSLHPENIFKGTAWYYARYRRPYPVQLLEDTVSYFKLDGKGKLLDLGCGTGELTLPLAKYFEEAVGVDPNADMLAEAKTKADREGVLNIRWIEGKAEDIDLPLAPIRLTTAGVSFHWMNQPVVFEKVYTMTEKDGGMVIIGDMSPVRGKEKTEDWKMKRKELVVKYLGEERRAGDYLHKDFIPVKRPFEELIAESSFRTFERKEYLYTTERNIDEIVGFLFSTSYANKRLLGERADEFEAELRQELIKLVPSGKFLEDGKCDVFLLRKE